MTHEVTSTRIATLAAKGLKAPSTLTCKEIKALCASVLTQRPAKDRGLR